MEGDGTTENKELINKMASLVSKSQESKTVDFDTGLLHSSFEKKSGSFMDRYESHSEDLINIATRLENIKIEEGEKYDKRFDRILSDIDDFLKEKIPRVDSDIDDYTGKDGRYIKIKRGDSEDTSSCETESLKDMLESIRTEHFYHAINRAKMLKYKARAYLKKDVFAWHENPWHDNTVDEVDPNGNSG